MEAYSQLAASSPTESLTCDDAMHDRVLNKPRGLRLYVALVTHPWVVFELLMTNTPFPHRF